MRRSSGTAPNARGSCGKIAADLLALMSGVLARGVCRRRTTNGGGTIHRLTVVL